MAGILSGTYHLFRRVLVLLFSFLIGAGTAFAAPRVPGSAYDVVVYGATPAGVMAAVAAARHGRTVALIDMNAHVGGMLSSGESEIDGGDRRTVGGMAAEFTDRVAAYYRDANGPTSRQFAACRNGQRYEPHVAERVFESMLWEQPSLSLFRRLRFHGIAMDTKGRITALIVDDLEKGGTRSFTGKIFIDASYEGDLMAATDVPWRAGREGRDEYGEELAGISVGPDKGKGDDRLMAFNYLPSLTNVAANRAAFPPPEHYDPTPWRALYAERIEKQGMAGIPELFTEGLAHLGPNGKFEANWCDLTGANDGYVQADWPKREEIATTYRDYFLSLVYYLQNDPDLPVEFRQEMAQWGLPLDEFADTGHFPFQLHVREARRMIGQYVLTERDITQDRYKADGIAEGSRPVDCQPVQTLMIDETPTVDRTPPLAVAGYDIPYGCLVPADMPGQALNLLVPVCCSATHVAFCSLRGEAVFMMLGQAAGDAAHLALNGLTPEEESLPEMQKIDVGMLRDLLRDEGAILDTFYQPPVKIVFVPEHPRVGQTVTFRAESGELRDPPLEAWWDFDGTGTASANGREVKTSFLLEKVYQVGLAVQDHAGRRRFLTAEVPVGAAHETDVTVDEGDAAFTGSWEAGFPLISRQPLVIDTFLGPSVHFTVVPKVGEHPFCRATFEADLPRAGRYAVCLAFRPAQNQAPSVGVTVRTASDTTIKRIDQQSPAATLFPWVVLGEFKCEAGQDNAVEITNDGADGRVAVDAVRWVWLGDGVGDGD